MSADAIRAKYDELNDVANALEALAGRAEQVEKNISQARQDLSGEWVGFGADRFFDEMDNEIIPSLGKLGAALHSASATTTLISNQFLETETADAAAIKGSTGAQPGPTPNSPWGDAGTPASAMPPPNSDSTQPMDTDEIFTEEYYDELFDGPDSDIKGAGDEQLKDAMTTLAGDPTPEEVDQALDQIAEARGVPREQIEQDYEQFKQLKTEAESTALENNKPPSPPLDLGQHSEFMGSEEQLQTGKIIGDALGIDPVFGSLLNPTGGIIGRDNDQVSDAGNETGLGRHGIVHDAGGYLLKYHDIGPGYDYLNLEEGRGRRHPMTGQESGIKYWQGKMGETGFWATMNELGGQYMGGVVDYQEYLENEHDYTTIYGTGHNSSDSSYDEYGNN